MNVVKRIERVALAVKDLAAARVFFEKLGARFHPEEVIEDMGIRYLPFDLGTSRMELLQATREDSPVARFLASRGQGVHHVTLEVEDLDQAIEELERADVPIHARHEYAPGVTFEGCVWREAFVHPRHSFGVLLHLAEKRPAKG
ncbi:MAG: VOC family protein [Planctomycetes bacterium]|nr:VOC family protein [Planctomycetota bacterium]